MSPKILGGSWYTRTLARMSLNPVNNDRNPTEWDRILGFRTVRNGRQPNRA